MRRSYRLAILAAIAAFFMPVISAYGQTNYTSQGEHWPTSTTIVNGCSSSNPATRCIAIYDYSGYGDYWLNDRLIPSLLDFSKSGYFQWVVHRGPRLDLNAEGGVASAYNRQHFGGIVVGFAGVNSSSPGDWEVDVSYGEADGDPSMGDLPDWYSGAGDIAHTAIAFVAIDNKSRVSVEHEIGHAMGLTHWPLQGTYYECVQQSVMCGDGEYSRLAPEDFKTLDVLYNHYGFEK